MEKLGEDTRDMLLQPLLESGWILHGEKDALVKKFKFKNFIDAFGWMTRVAIWAEKWDHHPEWDNIYATVNVVLITHDVNGLSALDLKLARKMDSLAV
ncbi:MAG: 4a-hydroxytetrahydrobiopterin dehydratase [Ascidiaceihabitans sp.]|jgi:4a-hydroxytetrahydrobiopterin dehydratase|tara:strand:- start:8903 stop:9196 length:294 start_codon:yes stop_codon:yes gene_type:complete